VALWLDISDKIKAKHFNPKDVIKSLKRRINHKNPNVQILALKFTDVCVKNSGHHFLVELSARDFIDSLVSLLKSPVYLSLLMSDRNKYRSSKAHSLVHSDVGDYV
jgi:growth factor-regulated tyrosine kinase substrate